jgi:hypothetical protein
MGTPLCRFLQFVATGCIVVLLSGCGRGQVPAAQSPQSVSSSTSSPQSTVATALRSDSDITPKLIGVSYFGGRLESWTIGPVGSNQPARIGKLATGAPVAMAANGNDVMIANQNPPEVIVFDVRTKQQTTLSDTNGAPADVAVGRDGTIYVANVITSSQTGNVTMYPQGESPGQVLSCDIMGTPAYIAVDDIGNVFLNGYSPTGTSTGVYEIRETDGSCTRLDLQPEIGYAAGLAYNRRTGALLVMDNPGACGGGVEGRIRIYPRPYSKDDYTTVFTHSNCAEGLRLDASFSIIFVGDSGYNGGVGFVRQYGYPPNVSAYRGVYAGVGNLGFTTIPNALPN